MKFDSGRRAPVCPTRPCSRCQQVTAPTCWPCFIDWSVRRPARRLYDVWNRCCADVSAATRLAWAQRAPNWETRPETTATAALRRRRRHDDKNNDDYDNGSTDESVTTTTVPTKRHDDKQRQQTTTIKTTRITKTTNNNNNNNNNGNDDDYSIREKCNDTEWQWLQQQRQNDKQRRRRRQRRHCSRWRSDDLIAGRRHRDSALAQSQSDTTRQQAETEASQRVTVQERLRHIVKRLTNWIICASLFSYDNNIRWLHASAIDKNYPACSGHVVRL